jgi:hypothetical protein
MVAVAALVSFPQLSEREVIRSWNTLIEAVDTPIIVYAIRDSDLKCIAVNDALARFHRLERDQFLGKSPAQLHIFLKNILENYNEWTEEQMERLTKATEKGPDDLGPSHVPMRLLPGHPCYSGNWRLSTKKIRWNGHVYGVTMFSRMD